MKTKICKDCNQEKEIGLFYHHYDKNRKSHLKLYSSYCKECERERSKKYNKLDEVRLRVNKARRDRKLSDPEYKEKINTQQRDSIKKNVISRLLSNAKNRAKKLNIDFNLDKNDIIIPTHCPILKVKLIPGIRGDYRYTPSLDRINNSLGYIKGNVAVISMLANTMKNSATMEEILSFTDNIKDYLQINEDIVRTIEK